MLKVFGLSKEKIGIFDDYDDFLNFITALENQKLLEGSPSFGRGYWAFAEYSPEKLVDVCAWVKPGYLTTVQTKALEQKLGLVEICRGDPGVLQEFPVTPELDVNELKNTFCLDYCRNRGWRLVETRDHKASSNHWIEKRRYVVHPYTRKSRLSQMNLNNLRGRRLKAELDCCIERLQQQQPVAAKSIPAQAPGKNGEF